MFSKFSLYLFDFQFIVFQVQVVNSGGGSSGYRHYRESHYAGGGSGGRYVERYGPGSKPKYVVAENGPQYVVRR